MRILTGIEIFRRKEDGSTESLGHPCGNDETGEVKYPEGFNGKVCVTKVSSSGLKDVFRFGLLSHVYDERVELPYVTDGPNLFQATEGSAGIDLFAAEDVKIYPLVPRKVRLGTKFAIPKGYVGLMRGRSGNAFNKFVWCFDGTIDSDFRGEVSAQLLLFALWPVTFAKGERVAQILIVPSPPIKLMRKSVLDVTKRGENGYGSTGS
jgi:dUTP pyrophosphatase